MNKVYILLILLSAAFVAKAQPTLPLPPVACNASSCITNSNIDVCPPGNSTVVTSHIGGVYNRNNNANHLGAGAVWRYRNIATVGGVTINGEVTIDAISNATLDNIDDDAALDQANVSIASFFAPRIGPDQNLNGTDRRGYVQFTMTFFKNPSGTNNNSNSDFANVVNLNNINYVHYDIDGNDANNVTTGTPGSWFRETGVAKKVTTSNPIVLANGTTELVPYNYTDPGTTNWTGFAGTICERDGVSRCAQVASSFSYSGALPSITFRMGYDYNAGGNIGRPIRQYGSRLGCFNFPSQSTLPVKLNSFTAIYRNQQTKLNWSADAEINFDRYIIERSGNGRDFDAIGERVSVGGASSGRVSYDYVDDLASESGTTFYYRLKMLDKDGHYEYSSILMIRKEAKAINGIVINPNPVVGGTSTIRFTSATNTSVDLRVMDISGKVVLQQQNKVYEGNNSVTVSNLGKLQSGIYMLQVINDGDVSVVKFTIAR